MDVPVLAAASLGGAMSTEVKRGMWHIRNIVHSGAETNMADICIRKC